MKKRSTFSIRSRAAVLEGALLTVLALALATGCDYAGGVVGGGAVADTGPSATPQGPVAGSNPAVGSDAFNQTVYPMLRQFCGTTCHIGGGTDGSPFIAHPTLDTAYHAVVDNQKVNLAAPGSSRLVARVVGDHNCWTSDCDADGALLEAQIAIWAQMVEDASGGTTVSDGLTSGALRLQDGIEDVGDERYGNGLLAFWDFKEGTGVIAEDTSGVDPSINLLLEGDVTWMSNYGVAFNGGRLISGNQTSRKLFNRIASPDGGTQQYSIEAWLIPDNTDQGGDNGPARIFGMSQNSGNRNFTMGQVLYNYNFRNRTVEPEINDNGTPSLQTYDADQDLQATLQHVVYTFDQVQGRRIYVNTRWTDDVDEVPASRLWNWDDTARVVMGDEASGNREWIGRIQLAAIYDHAIPDWAIQQNFDAGVGKRLLMRFDVSQWLGPGSFIEATLSELDEYSYLFCTPAIVTTNPNGFRIANLRISVNGIVPVSGQAFVNIDQQVTTTKQLLSTTCSILPKDQGPDADIFAIEFEVLGGFDSPVVVVVPPAPTPVFGPAMPNNGLRDFARIHESMAAVTGVDPNARIPDPQEEPVQTTYLELQQQLPGGYDLRAVASAHQVAASKLALDYCDRMVDVPALRDAFFGTNPQFPWGVDAFTAFGDAAARNVANRALITQRLVENVLGEQPLGSSPDVSEVGPILDTLFDDLTEDCRGCDPLVEVCEPCDVERTGKVVKGACAAVLGSAAVTIH